TILVIITILGIIFAKPLTKLIAFGFTSKPEKLDIAVVLTKIMFPYLLFACLAALLLGVLNSLKSFFLPAIAPAGLSVSEILCIFVVFSLFTFTEDQKIKLLALSVVLGGFVQYFIQQLKLTKYNLKIKLNFDLNHPGLKKILILMLPTMIGFSVDQVNAFVDTICASFLREGSITALYYSNRLMQLPLALFGIAMATVSLPLMSSSMAENNIQKMKETFNFSLRMVLFSLVPASVGLITLGLSIIRALFEYGKFDSSASELTYSALAFYSLGLISFSFVKVSASAFYSMKETRIPVKIATLCMILNAILNIILMKPLGVGGLALATTISSSLNAFLLIYNLRKKIGPVGMKKIFASFIKISVASLVMGIAVFILSKFNYIHKIVDLAIIIGVGILIYFFLTKFLDIEERKPLLEFLREKFNIGDE
ncbi:MAG: murein biosynthesis integral membrane protein MurJ, partial [Endomicrobiia bacterium]